MAKAYSYLRLSSVSEPESHAQRRYAEAAAVFCKHRNIDLDLMAPAARAGGSLRAPHSCERTLADFTARIRGGAVPKGSYLLVETLDRVARNAAAGVAGLLAVIVELGVTVITLPDEREYTAAVIKADATALLYAVVALIQANFHSALISRRLRASWRRRRELAHKKEPISAICPAWLSLDRATGAFIVNRDRARVVQRIYRDTLRGMGQHQIARTLNAEGVAVFGRGAHWHRSYIVKVLRSPAVVGTWVPHTVEYVDGKRLRRPVGEGIRNYFPRIIMPDVFKQAQALVHEGRSPLRGRHAKAGTVANLLGGLTYCGRCGASVTLVNKGTAARRVRYLVCSAARVKAGCRRYEAIRYERVEDALLRHRDWLFSTMPAGAKAADLSRKINEADAATYRIADALENLLSQVERGGRSATISVRIRELESEHEEFRNLSASLRAERETTSGTYVRHRANELQRALAHAPIDRTRVNALMRQVFSDVKMDFDGGDMAFHWRHGGQSEIDFEAPRPRPVRRPT